MVNPEVNTVLVLSVEPLMVPSTVKFPVMVTLAPALTSPVRLLVPSTIKLVPTVSVFVVVTSPVRLLVPEIVRLSADKVSAFTVSSTVILL